MSHRALREERERGWLRIEERDDSDQTDMMAQQHGGHHHPHQSSDAKEHAKTPDPIPATPDEFLQGFRMKTSDALCNAYTTKHPIYRSRDGRLTTSLGAEIFTLFNMLLEIMDEYLAAAYLTDTDAGDALVIDVVEFLLLNLKYKQTHFRNRLLNSLESCCAASNDFWGMTETAEEVTSKVLEKYNFRANRRSATSLLRKKSNDLIALYSADAVYAAQMTHLYVFEPICDSIENDLFGREWEENLTQNEVALSLVRTLDDFFSDIEVFLADKFLAKKVADSLLSATVIFYVRCLLLKARQKHWLNKHAARFLDPQRAMTRINGDISVMKRFFLQMVSRMPALSRGIEKEFAVLVAIQECMTIGAATSDCSLNDFVIILHKFTRNFDVTRHVVGDLFHLVAPDQEHEARAIVTSMKKQLRSFGDIGTQSRCSQPTDRLQIPGLVLEDMLLELYDIHGLGGHLQRLSPKSMIENIMTGAARERPVILNYTERAYGGVKSGKVVSSIQSLRKSIVAHRRRGEF